MKSDILTKNRDIIITEINKIVHTLETKDEVDEYIYIILWRPVEWILDYYALEDYLQHNTDAKAETLIKKRAKMTVDEKVHAIPSSEPDSLVEAYDQLRWYRNATYHRYDDLNLNQDIFHYFQVVCDSFYSRTDSGNFSLPEALPSICWFKVEQHIDIEINEPSQALVAYAENFYKPLSIYRAESTSDSLEAIVLMEAAAQKYAKELIDGRNIRIEYRRGEQEKNGIYIDGNRWPSFIDYYTSSSMKCYPSELSTCEKMKTLRDIRNKVVHNVSGQVITEEYKTIWLELMRDWFYNDTKIRNHIEKELALLKTTESLAHLKSFSSICNKMLSKKLVVDIDSVLLSVAESIEKMRLLQEQYKDQLENASDEEREYITNEMAIQMNSYFDEIRAHQGKKENEEFQAFIRECLGEYYGYLDDKMLNSLVTALTVQKALTENRECDLNYAAVCTQLTCAIEHYLYEKVYKHYREYVLPGSDVYKNVSESAKKIIKYKKISLGKYKDIMGIGTDNSGEETYQVYREFCSEVNLYHNKSEDALKALLAEEVQLIDVVKDYRNDAAHGAAIDAETAERCMEDILTGDNAILKRLLIDMEEVSFI